MRAPPYANGTSSSLGCFFADGFLSHVLGDGAALDIAPLFQFGELITSVHVKTALDLALFHAVRTDVMCHATEGNAVALNLTRCGMYVEGGVVAVVGAWWLGVVFVHVSAVSAHFEEHRVVVWFLWISFECLEFFRLFGVLCVAELHDHRHTHAAYPCVVCVPCCSC